MRIVTPAIEAYFAALYARIGEAVPVPFESVSIEEWQPVISDCHNNAGRWAEHDAGRKVIRGWLTWGLNEFWQSTFIAHSVIEDRDGRLFDVTPIDPHTPRPDFLRHDGTAAEFDAMQPEWSSADYPFTFELDNSPAEIDDPWLL